MAYDSISVEFTDKIQHVADAEHLGGRKGHIRFSKKEWRRMSYPQKVEVIIHEVCHIMHDYKFPSNNDRHHGVRWQLLMKAAGIGNPKTYI